MTDAHHAHGTREATPRADLDPWLQAAGLVVALAVCLGVGAIGGLITSTSVDTWYPTLDKPAFTPPGSVIGTVWTALYILMGLAAWQVWRKAGFARAKGALSLFGAQLVLNLAWSVIFFGLQNPGWALVEIVVLFAAIAWTTRAFHRIDAGAAYAMAPYLAWVVFASILNAAIWWMN